MERVAWGDGNDPPASPEGEADGGQARRHGEKARRREQGERQNEKCGSRDPLAGRRKRQ